MSELPSKLPVHIAIIMDGNGRWAQSRGLDRLEGHREGSLRVLDIARACREWGIQHLTLYAFSTENWKRPSTEVGGLMELLRLFLVDNQPELVATETRLRPLGDIARLPARTREQLEITMAATAGFTKNNLNIALNYGARDEILRATRLLAEEVQAGKRTPADLTEDDISDHLYTTGQPDPDLMIRTSGEQRISNYLLWQLAYAELIFSPVAWPDFTPPRLLECLHDYEKRERRFGLTGEQLKTNP